MKRLMLILSALTVAAMAFAGGSYTPAPFDFGKVQLPKNNSGSYNFDTIIANQAILEKTNLSDTTKFKVKNTSVTYYLPAYVDSTTGGRWLLILTDPKPGVVSGIKADEFNGSFQFSPGGGFGLNQTALNFNYNLDIPIAQYYSGKGILIIGGRATTDSVGLWGSSGFKYRRAGIFLAGIDTLGNFSVNGAVKPKVVICNPMGGNQSLAVVKNASVSGFFQINCFIGADSIILDSAKVLFYFAAGAGADTVIMDSLNINIYSDLSLGALGTAVWGNGTDQTVVSTGYKTITYNTINKAISPFNTMRWSYFGKKMAANGDITIYNNVMFCHYK